MPKRAASPKISLSWQLKIELLDVTPTVWRRLIVPETIKLPKLDRAIQGAFGWTNSHLHEFIIAGTRYAHPDPEWAEELKQVDETRIGLLNALGYEARSFDYVYDFGDHWHHVAIVEGRHLRTSPTSPVHCSAGENACPPEDVGGAHGYAEFLEALADPDHEEHERYVTWAGGEFDAKRLDLEAINRTLAKTKI
jgi:Plasmid pRiA4b ORF-3-like protein